MLLLGNGDLLVISDYGYHLAGFSMSNSRYEVKKLFRREQTDRQADKVFHGMDRRIDIKNFTFIINIL